MTEAPHGLNRKNLHQFYADLLAQKNWNHLLPFAERLDELLRLSEMFGLFTFTSHERLVFSKHSSYPEWFEDDSIVIAPLTSGDVEVGYVKQKETSSEKAVTVSYQQLVSTVRTMLEQLSKKQPPEIAAGSSLKE